MAFPFRIDKQTILQYYCEKPLVSSFTDSFINPCGHNATVAIMLHTGYNQQDSLIVNRSSVQRGLFNGSFFNYNAATVEKGEFFRNPADCPGTIVDKHSDAVADFVDRDGIATVGTIIKRNYVIISKVAISSERGRNAKSMTVDKSVLYKSRTPAFVMRIVHDYNDKKVEFVRVKWRQEKNLIIGDKISSRTGNKGIVGRLVPACDLPYTEDGIVPDILVNAQSMPTRRAVNQIIESLLGEYAVTKGCHVDGNSFLPLDVARIIAELNACGIKYAGYRRMYNGQTGDWIDVPICVGPTSYQRLQKFADNESYATRHGPTNAMTRQPIRGKNDDGSLRIGEMEEWVLAAHGTARALATKFFEDSDGTHIHVCSRCQNRAVFIEEAEIYKCRTCLDMANIVAVPSCFASNLYQHEVRGLGIKMKLEPRAHEFEEYL